MGKRQAGQDQLTQPFCVSSTAGLAVRAIHQAVQLVVGYDFLKLRLSLWCSFFCSILPKIVLGLIGFSILIFIQSSTNTVLSFVMSSDIRKRLIYAEENLSEN